MDISMGIESNLPKFSISGLWWHNFIIWDSRFELLWYNSISCLSKCRNLESSINPRRQTFEKSLYNLSTTKQLDNLCSNQLDSIVSEMNIQDDKLSLRLGIAPSAGSQVTGPNWKLGSRFLYKISKWIQICYNVIITSSLPTGRTIFRLETMSHSDLIDNEIKLLNYFFWEIWKMKFYLATLENKHS